MGELKKELGLKEVVATVTSAVVGAGLFLTTVQIQQDVHLGSSVILSYIISAIPATLVALCYATLAAAMPQTGGDYIFMSRILDPYVGFIVTWARWFGMIATVSAVAIGDLSLVNSFLYLLGQQGAINFINAHSLPIAIIEILVFMIINYIGIKIYARVQLALFIILMFGIGVLLTSGLPLIDLNNITSSFNGNLTDLVHGSAILFFSYIGFAAITDASGEVKNPERNLPIGMVLSVVLIAIIYISVSVFTYGVLPLNEVIQLGNVSAIAVRVLPSYLSIIVSFGAFIALISDINPEILATSRLSLAWARDQVVPQRLSELSRYNTPKWTLAVNASVAIAIVTLFGSFIDILNIVNIAILLTYTVIGITTFVFPLKHPKRWAIAPVKIRGLWLLSTLSWVLTGLLFGILIANSLTQFVLTLVWMGLGSIVYYNSIENHKLHAKMYEERKKKEGP
jgi:APA family basic amino acid/polyamine antiporter